MSPTSPLAGFAAALALALTATAQRLPDPLQFVPADCDVVMRMRGPAAWKREFAGTGLGRALTSPALAPKWDQLFDSLAASAEVAVGRRESFAALPGVLREYGGELVVALRLDWQNMTFAAGLPPGAALIAFAPDRESEGGLPKVRDALLELFADDPVREVQLAGQQVPLRPSGRGQLAGPTMIHGCLVLVVGTDLERSAPPFFAVEPGGPPPIAPNLRGATLGLQVAVGRCIDGLCAVDEPGGEANWMGVIRDLGFGSIDRLTIAMFPDGHYVGQTFGVEHTAGAEGLMRLLLPFGRQKPALLRLLPEHARTFSVAPLHGQGLAEFYPRLVEIAASVTPSPVPREAVEATFTEFTKLRLVEDVLALIGDEYMVLPDSAAPMAVTVDDGDDDPSLRVQQEFGNSCFLLQVRDGKAWGDNLETVLRARGLHVARKREEYAGVTIHSMTLLGMVPIEFATTADVFVIGVGGSDGTKRNLRAVLDRAAAAGDVATADAAFLPAVRERIERLPRRWQGLEVASITEVIDGMSTSIGAIGNMVEGEGAAPEGAAPEDGPWQALYELLVAVRPELAQHQATTVVSTTYYSRSRYLCRSRW